jgi:hypothetical protein
MLKVFLKATVSAIICEKKDNSKLKKSVTKKYSIFIIKINFPPVLIDF